MQNNVTDLSQKLQRSLDNNYNVIDMPAVIEIISTLEKTAVTKELLETTRLGKYINELRRRTTNESLAKRAKELVKKWRDLILPDAAAAAASNNGQIRPNSGNERSDSPDTSQLKRKRTTTTTTTTSSSSLSPGGGALVQPPAAKKSQLNGQSREFDFSDNSNCSVKDLKKTDVIFINSDSNSSMPDHHTSSNETPDTIVDHTPAQPKKRGRKKGSKNHKNLLIAAENSFTSKMAVSRNSKVKTTQELLADLQNRTVVSKQSQDIELRAAQLTESLSRIDQKLNPQKQINKNVTPIKTTPTKGSTSASSTITINNSKTTSNRVSSDWSNRNSPEIVTVPSDDEIVDVVGTDPIPPSDSSIIKTENLPTTSPITDGPTALPEPLTIKGLLAQLPPIDVSCLDEPSDIPVCLCPLPPVQEVQPPDKLELMDQQQPPGEGEETEVVVASVPAEQQQAAPCEQLIDDDDLVCDAKTYLRHKYRLEDSDFEENLEILHSKCLENVNGNRGLVTSDECVVPEPDVNNIVPNLASERLAKNSENYSKYSISFDATATATNECDMKSRTDDDKARTREQFREWHETLDVISYNDEMLRILPYVIID